MKQPDRIAAFFSAIEASPEHAARLAAIPTGEAGADALIAWAAELGHPLTREDLAGIRGASGELEDASLGGLAGGFVAHGPAGQRVIDWAALIREHDLRQR